ncbi:MAG: bifunctional hydroxymethylpyrimidine kinase/phosphomethylpyrimidine kinase [Paludibacteraceae bacterium]|nr:bifunctional hydroxymethylpyrimidine kinase/phosphomethylpyrimidine kinase [Paludibacteraceae bacterium]
MEIILSIAGSDPSAGAGIQQDLKTITALGGYGATVITALTSQSTMGVSDVMPVPARTVRTQFSDLAGDMTIAAIKIGQIPNLEVAQTVVGMLSEYLTTHAVPIVCDPIMVSTSGHPMMQPDCVRYVAENLFPLCRLVTPNLPETETLLGATMTDTEVAGRALADRYGAAFLIKGGHALGAQSTDLLVDTDGSLHRYETPRIESRNLHGTGCTLSSAIATRLAQGADLPQAVADAKQFVRQAIERGKSWTIGHGNGPLRL